MLFDPAEQMFSPMALKAIKNDWPGVFRTQILHLMPVGQIASHFHDSRGIPTKELYGMAGTIFLKELFNLSIAETVRHYLTDAAWQYALNVPPLEASLGHATVERYMKLFAEDDLAAEVFHRVASALIEALELDVSVQRLDSTHVLSDMAVLGRTRLMGVAISRFLVQLRRHHRDLYDALPAEITERYSRSPSRMFADHEGSKAILRQAVAEQLLALVERFADVPAVAGRTTYKAMRRVLDEQCEVTAEAVRLKAATGGEVMQNPSDPDATYDGHKGPGYQAQIAETCSAHNDVQLITAVEVEPAHADDQEALVPMLDQLDQHGRRPATLYADQKYGRDTNVTAAEAKGVDLQSPVGGTAPQNPDDLTVDDFVIDEKTEIVERCPVGHVPCSSVHDSTTGKTETVMAASICDECAFRCQCPVIKRRRGYVLHHTGLQRRSAARRAEQATEAFRTCYRIRAGGESVNSGLKRKTGIGRLRTRGLVRMRMGILLRCAGWNVLQAVRAIRARRKAAAAALAAAFLGSPGCQKPAHGFIMLCKRIKRTLRPPSVPTTTACVAA
ncbi:MAG: transposase [Wenzhouxiangella sp.]